MLPQYCEPTEGTPANEIFHTARIQTQLSAKKNTWLEDTELHLQNKGNLTHSQSTLNTFSHDYRDTQSLSLALCQLILSD